MKLLIFDSSSLITMTMNGLEYLFKDLKKMFNGKFIMTDSVHFETIDRPSQIKRFELGALQIKSLLDEKIFEKPDSIGINNNEIKAKTKEILNQTNKSYFARNEFMHIIDDGEASCIALNQLAREKGIDSVIVIDERTTRMLGENPENLRKLFQDKLHTRVDIKQSLSFLNNIKFIRSCELVYVAYKKGLITLRNGNVLDALLYASKFKGCSISHQEIEEMKRL